MAVSKKDTMSCIKKFLVITSLIILFITVYLTFSDHQGVDILIKSNDKDKSKSYFADKTRFDDIKAIKRVIDSEFKELEKVGIKREKSDYLMTHRVKKKKKVSDKQKDTNLTKTKKIAQKMRIDSIKKAKIRLKYNFRNPQKKDLLKLTKELLPLEPETDPLPTSAICDNTVFLTVLVVSSPNNYLRRQFIRDTWGYSYLEDVKLLKNRKAIKKDEESIPLKNMFRTFFVMGQTEGGTHMKDVYEEARLNKDMIFGSLFEDYKNLTLKTRLGLKWAFYDCDCKYVVKTDDDVFINPVLLVEWLKDKPRNNFYTGWCNFGSPVNREPGHKWYVSRQQFDGDVYPGYCLGGGYLMSNDVLGKVVGASYGRSYFPMEDVYVGLMINEMKEVQIQDEKGHFDLVYAGRSNTCDFNQLFLAHQVYGKSLVNHRKWAREALTMCN